MSNTESTASGQAGPNLPVSGDFDDLPEIYIGGVRSSGERPDVIITEVHDANTPSWSRRRAIITSAIVGAFFGSVFFAGYAATSAWICSARLDCGNWAPIAIVAATGAAASTVAGGVAGYILHKMYRLFKVA